jgi:hypothetical protein
MLLSSEVPFSFEVTACSPKPSGIMPLGWGIARLWRRACDFAAVLAAHGDHPFGRDKRNLQQARAKNPCSRLQHVAPPKQISVDWLRRSGSALGSSKGLARQSESTQNQPKPRSGPVAMKPKVIIGCVAALGVLVVLIGGAMLWVVLKGWEWAEGVLADHAERAALIERWTPPPADAEVAAWFPSVAGEFRRDYAGMGNTLGSRVGLTGDHREARYVRDGGHVLLAVIPVDGEAGRHDLFEVLQHYHNRQSARFGKSISQTPGRIRTSAGDPRFTVVAWHAHEYVLLAMGEEGLEPESLIEAWLAASVEDAIEISSTPELTDGS